MWRVFLSKKCIGGGGTEASGGIKRYLGMFFNLAFCRYRPINFVMKGF